MPRAELKPNERYAFVGKTRSGKTALAMVLAGTFARTLDAPWQVWWFDTKNDPDDLKALRKWGFRNAADDDDLRPETGGLANAFYFRIVDKSDTGETLPTVDQVQALCRAAYNRGHVVIVIDEYVQACPSSRSAGISLLNCFQRGGGKNVGVIGLTQEPVYVPRQLISQATHICLLSLSFENDIKYVRNLCPIYVSPLDYGEPYGFYWKWVDGQKEWDYYSNQRTWYNQLFAAKSIPPIPEGVPQV